MLNIPDEVKDLLHLDSCKKNIRIHFPNGERADICNDLIVMNSVKFTESLCSQDTLKFGLCESPVFECEVVGVGNIKGATIEVSCEIFCDSSVSGSEWRNDLEHYVYAIPYGTFVVNESKRQADMNHRKVVAYGGTARLNTDNEILLLKNRASFTSQTAYSPDIFATMMMISDSKTRLSEATYTELETLDYTSYEYCPQFAGYRDGVGRYRLVYVNAIVYQISPSNQGNLYYFESEDPYMGINDIYNELEIDVTLREQMQKRFLLGTGIKARRNATQRGFYIYPYQAMQYTDTLRNQYIFMPYKAHYAVMNVGEEWPTIIRSCEFRDKTKIKVYQVNYDNYPKVTFTVPRNIKNGSYYQFDPSKIDYLKLFDKVLELSGVFGNLNRYGMLELINIQQRFGLKPSGTLYPDEDLYPEGVTGGKLLPQDYQTCWYDDDYTKPFGAIICGYKNTSNVESEFTYYLPGFSADSPVNSYQVYKLESNDIINNATWTENQIEAMCAIIASNIEGVAYMPVEFVGRGLPYVEAGDTFEILTASNDSITTIVLNRTISGEQVLTDSYKSV